MARVKRTIEEKIAIAKEAVEKQKEVLNREKAKLADLNQEYANLLREKRDQELNHLCDLMDLTGLSVEEVEDIVRREAALRNEQQVSA